MSLVSMAVGPTMPAAPQFLAEVPRKDAGAVGEAVAGAPEGLEQGSEGRKAQFRFPGADWQDGPIAHCGTDDSCPDRAAQNSGVAACLDVVENLHPSDLDRQAAA